MGCRSEILIGQIIGPIGTQFISDLNPPSRFMKCCGKIGFRFSGFQHLSTHGHFQPTHYYQLKPAFEGVGSIHVKDGTFCLLSANASSNIFLGLIPGNIFS